MNILYHILDIFFMVFHTILIFFNLSGWIWKKTRLFNLITLSVTGASWLLLGLLVGTLGYCPLTDWHFNILDKLGESDLPYSYVKYLADRITGFNFNAQLVDQITLYSFLIALIFSLFLNGRDFITRKRNKHDI